MKENPKRGKPGRPWQQDTLVNVYSCTKAMANLCVMHLVDRGLCTYADRVALHWPEFAHSGKENVTIEELLSHQAGLCYLDGAKISQEMLMEWTRAVQAGAAHPLAGRLAKQAPAWPLGKGAFGYHPLTVGFYVSELVRRIDPRGRGVRRYLHEELGPHGVEFLMGLGEADEESAARVAQLYQVVEEDGFPSSSPRCPVAPLSATVSPPDSSRSEEVEQGLELATLIHQAFTLIERFSPYRSRFVELPSAIGFGTTRSIAWAFAHLVAAGRGESLPGGKAPFLSQGTVLAAVETAVEGKDMIQQQHKAFSRCGLVVVSRGGVHAQDGIQRAVYHAGSGGSLVFGDFANGIALSYAPNALMQGRTTPGCTRAEALVRAVYECLRSPSAHL